MWALEGLRPEVEGRVSDGTESKPMLKGGSACFFCFSSLLSKGLKGFGVLRGSRH